jgi:hypothetical protein
MGFAERLLWDAFGVFGFVGMGGFKIGLGEAKGGVAQQP